MARSRRDRAQRETEEHPRPDQGSLHDSMEIQVATRSKADEADYVDRHSRSILAAMIRNSSTAAVTFVARSS